MATRPMTVRHRSGIERHAQSIPGVEAAAAYFGEFEPWSEIPCAPFCVGLEPAGGHDHATPDDLHDLTSAPRLDPDNTARAFDERDRSGLVMHRNAGAFDGGKQRPGETFAPVISFDCGTASKADEPVRRAELPAVEREELHPLGMQPSHRVAAVPDQQVCQPRVGAILGDP